MWKLIKMDFYRFFNSKALKVGALVACLLSVAYIFLSLGIVELMKLSVQNDPLAADAIGTFMPQVDWINGVNFSEIVLGGTSAFSLFVGCMIAANFIGTEQSCGYTKNFAGQLPNKGYMAISKFVVTSFAHLVILVIYAIISAGLATLVFGKYINGYAINPLLAALGLRLLLHWAINAIIIFICTLTKSHSIAMVVGSIFGIGVTKFAYLAAGMLLSMMKIKFDIINYMPDGINGQLSLNTVGELYIKAILVSLAFIAVFLTANYIVLQKRDVR